MLDAVLPEPTHRVTLPDGRTIAADVVGDPVGVPVVHLHGAPDCRLARHPNDAMAAQLGVRLIAVDRPGWGWSDPLPAGDGVVAWADDLAALLDDLGVERCRVAAWSAGAPFAWGAAAGRPERVDRITAFGAVALLEAFVPQEPDRSAADASPVRQGVIGAVLDGMPAVELAAEMASYLIPAAPVDLDLARDAVTESLGPGTRAALESIPGLVDQLALSLAAAVDRHGDAGFVTDITTQFSPGLLEVVDRIACPVTLVHGEKDPIAGPGVGEWFARRLLTADVIVWPTGHQGLLTEWPRWLELLAQ
jgi:pimeloyl-ACP methyl ester carboxylesterase